MNSSKTILDYLDENEELNLDKIIEDFSPYVKTIINNMSNNMLTQEDKEEILLDTFFVLWKNQYKITVLDSYIAGITRNLVKEKMKKRQITYDISEYENVAEYSNIDLLFEERDEIYKIRKSFKKLKEIDLKIIKLFYYLSQSTKEISTILGISETNVRQRLFKIRRKVEKELRKEDNFGK